MSDRKYNGWTNYETWNVALWMDNDSGDQSYWQEQAEETYKAAESTSYSTRKEEAARELADRIKEQIQDGMPDLGASLYSDILSAALSDVNWYEIAENLLSEIEEEVTK